MSQNAPLDPSIRSALTPRGSRILPFSGLAERVLGPLAGDEAARERLRERLLQLERQGELVRVRGEKWSLIEFTPFRAGTLAVRGEGKGWLLSGEKGVPDTPIGRGGLGGALDGDTVLVRLEKAKPARSPRGGRPARGARPPRDFGTVVKVLARKRRTVVGKIARGPEGTFVVPYDPKVDARLKVPDGKDLDAPTGIYVEALIVAYPDDKRLALAEVVETIGFEGDAGVDVEVVARKHGLPRVFPEPVLSEAEAAERRPSPEERAARADYTSRVIVTIDGETARDFDDAIEAEELPGGGFRLGVHIADVSWYVRPGSALDAEAFERGTSVYFPDRAIPMLPERLSNDLCSLRPDEERRTVSAILTIDASGETVKTELTRSLIRSWQRLTYTQVAEFLGGTPAEEAGLKEPVAAQARVAARAAKLLRQRRERRGSLDFDLPDADLILGETGDVVAIVKEVRNEAHRLIEEFMLAANEAVAKHLLSVPSPTLYRVHDVPDARKLSDLREVLHPLGYHVPEADDDVTPDVFQRILDQAEGKPEERFVSDLVLRSQRKALYAEECRGHYALAAPFYCHFTSPIRRYPDLVVHRAVVEWLATRRAPEAEEAAARLAWLETAGPHASERERRAEAAEREAQAWKKFVFLKDRVGEEFDAYVSAVVPFGMFVTLDEIYVDGLVPMDRLEDDFYRFEEVDQRLVGNTHGRVYRLGDRLRVVLERADPDRRTLDFGPAKASRGPRMANRMAAIERRRDTRGRGKR